MIVDVNHIPEVVSPPATFFPFNADNDLIPLALLTRTRISSWKSGITIFTGFCEVIGPTMVSYTSFWTRANLWPFLITGVLISAFRLATEPPDSTLMFTSGPHTFLMSWLITAYVPF